MEGIKALCKHITDRNITLIAELKDSSAKAMYTKEELLIVNQQIEIAEAVNNTVKTFNTYATIETTRS